MNKRLLALLSVLVLASMVLAACGTPAPVATEAPAAATEAPAAATEAPAAMYECTDALGCVTIAPDEPVHIAYWGVLSGPDSSLGEDSKRGVEIAIDDIGGKFSGHDILLTTEDGGCTPEGGATAATKLATDTSIVGLIGSSCSDETVGGIATLTNAGLTTISPSNTRPVLTDPARGPDYAGYLRTAHSDAFQGKAVAEFAYNYLGSPRLPPCTMAQPMPRLFNKSSPMSSSSSWWNDRCSGSCCQRCHGYEACSDHHCCGWP